MSGINNIKPTLPPNVSGTDSVTGRKNRPAENSQPSTAASTSSGSDKVSLTDTATQLQALQKQISDAPEVDESRVAAIKAAIADGSYKIDSQQLARKMIDFEGDF